MVFFVAQWTGNGMAGVGGGIEEHGKKKIIYKFLAEELICLVNLYTNDVAHFNAL